MHKVVVDSCGSKVYYFEVKESLNFLSVTEAVSLAATSKKLHWAHTFIDFTL
ncbi:hypothetical protein LBMAG12_17640 [Actinomycetes bacterium]|nr:hypothetical protein LBMAG12_17640 [Actinomycetes bacterium]